MTDRELPRVLPPEAGPADTGDGPTPAAEGLHPRDVRLEDEDLTEWATFGTTPVPQRLARATESGLGEILDQATTDQLREIIAAATMRLSEADDTGDV